MELKSLSSELSVTAQLSIEDVAKAAALGFKALINNRPDGESCCQPEASELASEAAANGLDYRHIPVVGGSISDADVTAFSLALDQMTGPVLAFCRSGKRSTILWALSQAPGVDPDQLIEVAKRAGYTISELKARLEARRNPV